VRYSLILGWHALRLCEGLTTLKDNQPQNRIGAEAPAASRLACATKKPAYAVNRIPITLTQNRHLFGAQTPRGAGGDEAIVPLGSSKVQAYCGANHNQEFSEFSVQKAVAYAGAKCVK
jgi:hypothetical protein